jgi:Protein of unknown function (DUF4054)
VASAPDIAMFRAKFSELSSVSDADIASCINSVDVMTDASMWPSKTDYTLARMLLAAHLVILQQQQLSNATIDGTGLSDLFVRQVRFGERAIAFAQRKFPTGSRDTAPGEAMLEYTYYGEQFLMLRARNIIGIVVI